VAHSTPINQKPSNAPIFVNSASGALRPKESRPGAGGIFLTRGEREVEVSARGEATARQEGEVVQ
jgi:hypothetical protein